MSFFNRLVISLLLGLVGYIMMTGTVPLLRFFGKLSLVEQYLGRGQSYLIVRLMGAAVLFWAALFLLGKVPWPF